MSSSGILGLPAYNAPEQLRSAHVSPATDVYALGMLFFELTTGVHPFLRIPTSQATADTPPSTGCALAHLNQPPPDPCQFNSSLPDGIGETISIALAKDPKQRYQIGPGDAGDHLRHLRCAGPAGARSAEAGCRRPANRPLRSCQPARMRVDAPGAARHTNTPPACCRCSQRPRSTNQMPAHTHLPLKAQQVRKSYPVRRRTRRRPARYTACLSLRSFLLAAVDVASAYLAEKPKRPAWFWIVIGAVAIIVVLCGIGLGAGLPILKDMLGTQTPTLTATFTAHRHPANRNTPFRLCRCLPPPWRSSPGLSDAASATPPPPNPDSSSRRSSRSPTQPPITPTVSRAVWLQSDHPQQQSLPDLPLPGWHADGQPDPAL